MRRLFFLLLCLLPLCLVPAMAENYTFSDIRASLDVPAEEYDVVLTPYNLSTHTEWLKAHEMDPDYVSNEFESDGVLLKAVNEAEGRTFVLTAQKNLDAETYFDLNLQDDSMRKEFRTSHTNGTAYGVLGYSYSSAKWQNYGENAQRFLKTQYTLRQNGQQVCAGYQRRTIRNGYTITLDMQVTGRSPKSSDESALESIMRSFQFTEILPVPPLPMKLSFTSAPPAETNEAVFTIKGSTKKRAQVTATVFSLGSSGSQTYSDTAASSGSFSMKVTLPSPGVYSITVTAQAEGAVPAQRMFSVSYQPGVLPVELTATPNATLSDQTIVSGSTTISGVKTQIAVSGPINYSKTTTSKNFSFKLDTSAEGEYTIILSLSKKGLEQRVFTYQCTRTYTEDEYADKVKQSAKKIAYSALSKADNKGKPVVITGYFADVQETGGEWIIKFAEKKSGETYKDFVYIISKQNPGFAVGDHVTVYGVASEIYSRLTEGNTVENFPRVEGMIFESAE